MPRTPATTVPLYQIKITLKHTKPPIWRRIEVPSDITLAQLHRILQIVMGWTDSHLHEFEARGVQYGVPNEWSFQDIENESTVLLSTLLHVPKSKARYTYDFGDDWHHDVVLEKVIPSAEGIRAARCVAGKRACPPEDCGGVWGYAELLETLADPESPEYEDLLDWLGDPFDPEAFDLAAVNAELQRVRL